MLSSRNDEEGRARRLKLQELQTESVTLDQDYRKKTRRLQAVAMEVRKLDRNMSLMKVERGVKNDEKVKLERDIFILETEMKRVKKKINLMS
ncbi:MAG: hypothetical protein WCL23_04400 [Candidatus Moraniibacteriota bacterium]